MRVDSRRTLALAAAATAVLVCTACAAPSGGTAVAAGGAVAGTSTAAPSSTSEPATSTPIRSSPARSTEPAPVPTDQAGFGSTYSWTDGLQVTVSAPTPFTPSEYAAADPATAYLSFTVTIVNNTGAEYKPSLFSATAQSGNAEADQVYDSANGLDGTPSTAILNGRQSTFQLGFGVADPNDVVLQVRPGFDYDDVFFTSSGPTQSAPPATAVEDASVDNQTAFGTSYSWTDGLQVTVSAPTPFAPSEYAAADPANAYLEFTITVTNRTGKEYDPVLFSVTAQSGNQEADQVYDSANGFTGTPSTAVLDGRESQFKIGFGVADANDVVMEVRPGFDYEEAYFTS